MAIQSFACTDTKKFFNEGSNKKFSNIKSALTRKLSILHCATSLKDLSALPGNGLHQLTKEVDLIGYHAIRINDQFRLCFIWTDEGPKNVKVRDYH